jgi:hypothetical protein
MNTTKKWYQSKTIWGILIALLGLLMTNLGVSEPVLPENADVTQIQQYVDALKEAGNDTQLVISKIMAIAGCLLAIYGRFKADTLIKADTTIKN